MFSFCNFVNDPESSECSNCGKPLDLQTALAKEEKEKEESISNRQLIDELQTQLVQLRFELKAVTTSVQTKYDDELQQRKEKLGID